MINKIKVFLFLIILNIVSFLITAMIILDDDSNILFGILKIYYFITILIFILILAYGIHKFPKKASWKVLLGFHFLLFFIMFPGIFLHFIELI